MIPQIQHLLSLIVVAAEVLGIACIPLVLVRRKESSSTVAWILVLLFLPVVGLIIFWFLGRDRVRRPVRGKHLTNRLLRDRLGQLPHLEPDDPANQRPSLPPMGTGVMRLANRVGRLDVAFGNEVQLLVDAPHTFEALEKAIDAAKHHVHLEYYIFRADEVGCRIIAALNRALQRGVRVRLLCDGFGSHRLRRAWPRKHPLRSFVASGGEFATFLPLDPFRRAWTINLRNHRKIVVVDGHVGFMGGINIGQEFLPWRDLHMRLCGPVVQQLQSIFVEDWFFATRKELTDVAYFPEPEAAGGCAVQVVDSGPDSSQEAVHRIYMAAIATARESVLITTPYLVPDRAILVALLTTALRGVDVQIIVPGYSNYRLTASASRSYYAELLQAGVRIFEYGPQMIHSKVAVVDNKFATLGSANLDVRSFRLNFELVAVIWDAQTVQQLRNVFREDLRMTEEIHAEQWAQRGGWRKVKEGFGRLWSPLL